ncbi:hypothetical protein [Metaclostridioides mangenotii]|uniref:hypothetical protein n=1 Tax=Metaclostridioides mangenotii TaxID=1540 RepID=UPI00048384DE|nr:hypothetical protein [Clostridioides mangenotii]
MKINTYLNLELGFCDEIQVLFISMYRLDNMELNSFFEKKINILLIKMRRFESSDVFMSWKYCIQL